MTGVAVLSVESLSVSETGGGQMAAAGSLIERLRDFLGAARVSLPPKEEFLKIVEEAYTTYVAPIDIPGVPNIVVEPWVDKMILAVLLQQASALYDAFAPVA